MQDIECVDFFALQRESGSSLVNMQNAEFIYMILVQQAEVTPYNDAVITRLKDFDYQSFMLENNLNPLVFAEVEEFLKNGDITGLLQKVHNDLVELTVMLKTVNDELVSNRVPQLPLLWKINETFSYLSLFGSFTARIFSAVL